MVMQNEYHGRCHGPEHGEGGCPPNLALARTLLGGLVVILCLGAAGCPQTKVASHRRAAHSPSAARGATTGAMAAGVSAWRGELHAFAWSKTPASAVNITPMIWISRPNRSLRAAALASRKTPAGDAAVFIWHLDSVYHNFLADPRDAARTPQGKLTGYPSPWVAHGTARLKRAALRCFRRYKADGGRMDYLILDYEGGLSNWQLNRATIEAIEHDPRSKALAQRLGFGNFASIEQYTTSPHYLIWNALMKQVVDNALNQSMFAAARQFFPQVKGSNYSDFLLTRRNAAWCPDRNGHPQFRQSYFGTDGSPVLYGWIDQLAQQSLGGSSKPYGREPFAVLRWELNRMRATCRSSHVPVLPWIAAKNFGSRAYAFRHSVYYNELIYQAALSGAADFLLFDPRPWLKTQNPAHWANDAQDMLVNKLLATLNRKFGNQPRRPITLAPIAWDSGLIATGMQIGSQEVLWRISVPPTVRRVRVADAGAVKIISVPAGKAGFWYESRPGEKVRFTDVARGRH